MGVRILEYAARMNYDPTLSRGRLVLWQFGREGVPEAHSEMA